MQSLDVNDIGFITGLIGLGAIIFTIYNYFRSPQIETEQKDALLAQQVQWTSEGTDRRFKDMQDSFNSLLLQSNNHIHTVEIKVDALTASMNLMSNEITKLSTILEERIPRK